MRGGERALIRYLSGIVPLLIGISSLAYSYGLGLGTVPNPGPGMWPFLVSIGVILSSAVVIGRPDEEYESFATSSALYVGFGVLTITLYVLLIGLAGFIISSFLFLVCWLKFINGEAWVTTLTVAVLGPASAYVVFVIFLGVRLPVGVFKYLGL